MATPIANNTEELREILQSVNSLPNKSGATSTVTGTLTVDANGQFGITLDKQLVGVVLCEHSSSTDFISFIAGQIGTRAAMFSDSLGGVLQVWLGIEGTGFGGYVTRNSWSFEVLSPEGITFDYTAYYLE